MSSWSCPHFDDRNDWCQRLNVACVPGRKGCVLPSNLQFAVPPDERVAAEKSAHSTTESVAHGTQGKADLPAKHRE